VWFGPVFTRHFFLRNLDFSKFQTKPSSVA
jgi:hypothetical protein